MESKTGLQDGRIRLRPMQLSERRKFFRWATRSDATEWWYGELYGDDIPDFEGFIQDWSDGYFDEESPDQGQCFVILLDEKEIGQINYNPISCPERATELDILIIEKEYYGKGIGSCAIQLLCRYLFKVLKVNRVKIEVVKQNERAFRAYMNVGFSWSSTYFLNGIEWRVMTLMRQTC